MSTVFCFVNMFFFIVGVSVSFAKTPDDFQQDLYKMYFPCQSVHQDFWEDFCSQPCGVSNTATSNELVVSLTSYPARIKTTWLAIESLLRQEEKPNHVILNLFEGDFPERKLPEPLMKQEQRGLIINWCSKNLKVYLKAIPVIERYPNAFVVIVDDDVIYPPNLLSDLLNGQKRYPDCVIARDVRKIKVDWWSYVLPVCYWNFTGMENSSFFIEPSVDLIPEGIGGILFPPRIFHPDFNKEELFFDICCTDDDSWFYTMIVSQGGRVVKVQNSQPRISIQNTQEISTALWRTNFRENKITLAKTFKKLFWAYNLGRILNAKDVLLEVNSVQAFSIYITSVVSGIMDNALRLFQAANQFRQK